MNKWFASGIKRHKSLKMDGRCMSGNLKVMVADRGSDSKAENDASIKNVSLVHPKHKSQSADTSPLSSSSSSLSLDIESNQPVVYTWMDNAKRVYKMEKNYANLSKTLETAFEKDHDSIPVLSDISSEQMRDLVAYMNARKGKSGPMPKKPLTSSNLAASGMDDIDLAFVETVSAKGNAYVYAMTIAVNYMDMPGLLEAMCAKVASLIRNQPIEKVRELVICTSSGSGSSATSEDQKRG